MINRPYVLVRFGLLSMFSGNFTTTFFLKRTVYCLDHQRLIRAQNVVLQGFTTAIKLLKTRGRTCKFPTIPAGLDIVCWYGPLCPIYKMSGRSLSVYEDTSASHEYLCTLIKNGHEFCKLLLKRTQIVVQ